MAKGRYNNYNNQGKKHSYDPMEIERSLVIKISETGKEQLKQRRKAGLSSFYAKEGRIIEVLPNNSENVRETIKSKWIVLEKKKRSVVFK
jgi:hypothetical protein